MTCFRCGYCCKKLWVPIVDKPELGVTEGNIINHNGNGENNPCKHLIGEKIGEYSCSLHDMDWYDETPCYAHNIDVVVCNMGKYLTKNSQK